MDTRSAGRLARQLLACRRPIVVGQKRTFVGNGEVGARFHEPCHTQWLTEQEIAARKTLG